MTGISAASSASVPRSVHSKSIFSSHSKTSSSVSLNAGRLSGIPTRRATSHSSHQPSRRPARIPAPLSQSTLLADNTNTLSDSGSFRSLLPRPKTAPSGRIGSNGGLNTHSQNMAKRGYGVSWIPKPVSVSSSVCPSLNTTSVILEDFATSDDIPTRDPHNDKLPSVPPPPSPGAGSEVARKATRLLISKRKDFTKMKRDLIVQQNAVLDAYAMLKELEQKAKDLGVRVLSSSEPLLEELQVVDVGSWGSFDLRLLTRDNVTPDLQDLCTKFGGSVIHEVALRLMSVPDQVMLLCTDLLAHQREQLSFFHTRVTSDKTTLSENVKRCLNEMSQKTDKLEEQVEGAVAGLRVKVEHVLDLTKIAWKDRDQLIKRLEKLKQELHVTQRKLEEGGDAVAAMTAAAAAAAQEEHRNSALEEVRGELIRERVARESLKALVTSADSTVRAARARIADLERQLRDEHAELMNTRRRHKEFEHQARQRETSFEQRSRKLKEVTNLGEATIETLTRQRDALEVRVKELNEQLASAADAATRRLVEERARCSSLQSRSAEQQAVYSEMEQRVRASEEKLRNAESTWKDIQERCDQLLQLMDMRRADLLPQEQESRVSDREIELWKELQSTRLSLARMKEDARKTRRDQDLFLQQLAKIAQNEGNECDRGKIAEEFIEKERINSNLQDTIEKLQRNEKLYEQRASAYESQIEDLKQEVLKLQNYHVNTNRLPTDDLQTQMVELQTQVSTARRERAALEAEAAASELRLERHERAAALQRQALRLREQLIQLLEGRTPLRQEDNSILDRHQLASLSAEFKLCSSAETWSVLLRERARSRTLERVLRVQHQQLQRENSERTKLENARAQLHRKLSQLAS